MNCTSGLRRIWLSWTRKSRCEHIKAVTHLFWRSPVWCQWSVFNPCPTAPPALWCHDALQSSLSNIYLVVSPHCSSFRSFFILDIISANEAFPVLVLGGGGGENKCVLSFACSHGDNVHCSGVYLKEYELCLIFGAGSCMRFSLHSRQNNGFLARRFLPHIKHKHNEFLFRRGFFFFHIFLECKRLHQTWNLHIFVFDFFIISFF